MVFLFVLREEIKEEISSKKYSVYTMLLSLMKLSLLSKKYSVYSILLTKLSLLFLYSFQAAYDSVLKAKELQRLRTQALDSKRKKFKQGKLLHCSYS